MQKEKSNNYFSSIVWSKLAFLMFFYFYGVCLCVCAHACIYAHMYVHTYFLLGFLKWVYLFLEYYLNLNIIIPFINNIYYCSSFYLPVPGLVKKVSMKDTDLELRLKK